MPGEPGVLSRMVRLSAEVGADAAALRERATETRDLLARWDRVVDDLQELRRFRHFFRNAYVIEVDATRLREQAERLRRIAGDVEATLDGFRDHVQGVVRALSISSG